MKRTKYKRKKKTQSRKVDFSQRRDRPIFDQTSFGRNSYPDAVGDFPNDPENYPLYDEGKKY